MRKNYVPEAYDGNVWEFFTWKRSNVVFVSIFWIFYCLMLIQLSFSAIFGVNIWSMIFAIKVMNIILNFIMEMMLEEALLSSSMEILGGLTEGLVTFGADNFVDFLSAYFIELGIQMFERTYVGDFVDMLVKYIEAKMTKLMDMKFSWFSSQDDFLMNKEMRQEMQLKKEKQEEENEKHLMEEPDKDDKKDKEKGEEDYDVGSSGSDIYISDDDEDFDLDDSANLDDSDDLLNNDGKDDSLDEIDKAKPVSKYTFTLNFNYFRFE